MTDPKKPTEQNVQSAAKPMRLKPASVTTLRYESAPPPAPEDKQIHRRRPLPLIPEGEKDANAPEDQPSDKED
jgi:hypothetical protein